MAKWEYATLLIPKNYGLTYRVNGEKVASWKDRPLHEVLQELGRAGFELVAFDGEQYIFKRPMVKQTTRLDENTLR